MSQLASHSAAYSLRLERPCHTSRESGHVSEPEVSHAARVESMGSKARTPMRLQHGAHPRGCNRVDVESPGRRQASIKTLLANEASGSRLAHGDPVHGQLPRSIAPHPMNAPSRLAGRRTEEAREEDAPDPSAWSPHERCHPPLPSTLSIRNAAQRSLVSGRRRHFGQMGEAALLVHDARLRR